MTACKFPFTMKNDFKVVIAGGGLVGSLAAVFFANRGCVVEVFEKRTDIRKDSKASGRSINLALSFRGIEALKAAGVFHLIEPHIIPMKGRYIHSLDGFYTQDYGVFGECINSVDRKLINRILLDVVEKNPLVTLNFDCSIESCDLKNGIRNLFLI
jgi:kynurenine 3-monooxygenase